MKTRISVEELQRATGALLAALRANGHNEIELDADFYWDLSPETRSDFSITIPGATVGQVSDDWKEVQSIADGTKEPIAYGLVWLASVLRAVGEKVVGY